MLDKNLVHAIIGGKNPDCGSSGLSLNLVLARRHGSRSRKYNTSGPAIILCNPLPASRGSARRPNILAFWRGVARDRCRVELRVFLGVDLPDVRTFGRRLVPFPDYVDSGNPLYQNPAHILGVVQQNRKIETTRR